MRLLTVTLACLLILAPFAASAREFIPSDADAEPGSDPSPVRADFEYNSAGVMDHVPEYSGDAYSWAEWFIVTVRNDTGYNLVIKELGFPCCGPPTGDHGWVVWTNMPGLVPPAGGPTTAQYRGPFAPADPGTSIPPSTYTYLDVSDAEIFVLADTYFCFGYQNTNIGGLTDYQGIETWGWYCGEWWSDGDSSMTAVLQVKADRIYTPVAKSTWGAVKSLYLD